MTQDTAIEKVLTMALGLLVTVILTVYRFFFSDSIKSILPFLLWMSIALLSIFLFIFRHSSGIKGQRLLLYGAVIAVALGMACFECYQYYFLFRSEISQVLK